MKRDVLLSADEYPQLKKNKRMSVETRFILLYLVGRNARSEIRSS